LFPFLTDSAGKFLSSFPISSLRYGEVVDVNLVRDKATGKSRGFVFVAYEEQRSTALAVSDEDSFQFLLMSLPYVVVVPIGSLLKC
jgi:hypothetical protein